LIDSGRLQFSEIFGGVSREFFDAGFAAEFYFLTIVDFSDNGAHGAQGIAGDNAGVFKIGLYAAAAGGSAGAEDEADGGEEESGGAFHLVCFLGWVVWFSETGFWS
jgi:hypothetical protein